jgi:hypothetical protein
MAQSLRQSLFSNGELDEHELELLLAQTEARIAMKRDPEAATAPTLSRDHVSWRNVGQDVEITIDIIHQGAIPSKPANLIVEAAPLGAFFSGYRIAELPVPAMDPGGNRRVTILMARNSLPSLGVMNWLIGETRSDPLPGRTIDLLSSAEWAGNLNLWFDVEPARSVELHRALDLKVGAGRAAAIGLFLPPDGDADYKMAIVRNGLGWTAEVVQVRERMHMLVVGAPQRVGVRAKIALLVTRVADDYIVPVDFSFESIEGLSESLGCIAI